MRNLTLRRNITATALGVIGFLVAMYIRIPFLPGAPYLKYDPSGFVFLMSGAMLGPSAGVTSAGVKLLLNFMRTGNLPATFSDFVASAVFLLPVSAALRRRDNLWVGVTSCIVSALITTLVMIPTNVVVLYVEFGKMPGEVMAMMLPAIIPFNLLKCLFNTVLYVVIGRKLIACVRRYAMNGEVA